ncbi:MAG: FkbM family methyltransferase [Methylocystis sp.]
MSTSDCRTFAKRILPTRIVRSLREFFRRISFIIQVARQIRGERPEDRKVLNRFLFTGIFSAMNDLHIWRDPPLPEDALVSAKGLGKFLIRGDTDDLAHALPSNYAEMFELIRAHVDTGDAVIDAGANIGAVSVYLGNTVGPSGHVVAVEMMPETAERLRRNIKCNSLEQVVVKEAALSNEEGHTVIAHVPHHFHGQASIAAGDRGGRATSSAKVRTTTLDAIASELGEIAFIKLDLEGAELAALQGASSTLRRSRCILFETWVEGGGSVTELLNNAGFEVRALDKRNLVALRRGTQRQIATG